MAEQFIQIQVTGINEVTKMLENLGPRLETNLFLGFQKYTKQHLVPRMKERLSRATEPLVKSSMGMDGVPSGGGGYGTSKNTPRYTEWKSSRSNLPIVGNLSTRELVATGYLVESIDVTHFAKTTGRFEFAVGARPGPRPKAVSMSSNPKGSTNADVSQIIENTQLVEWLEDTKYAFIAKECEDVMRDVVPLVVHILKITLQQLANEFFKGK
jgi:hypothetical protein